MHLAPNTDRVPPTVNRHLLPHERQVITVHRHFAILFGPVGLAVAGLVAALVLTSTLKLSSDAELITWLIWCLLLLYMIWKVASWFVDYYVITSYRMLVVRGFLARDVVMLPMRFATVLRLRRSTLGRMLGYGEFILEPRGQDRGLRTVKYLPFPDQLYLEVCGLIFPDREAQEGDRG